MEGRLFEKTSITGWTLLHFYLMQPSIIANYLATMSYNVEYNNVQTLMSRKKKKKIENDVESKLLNSPGFKKEPLS